MGVTVQSKVKKIATIVLASFCCLVLMLFYVTIPLQLCFWGLLWGFSLPNRLEEELDTWEPGMQDQVAIFRLSDSGISGIWKSERSVTVNGKKIDLTEVFGSSYFYDEYHSWRRLQEIFCVYDNTIYGMVVSHNFSEETTQRKYDVEIFSVDVESKTPCTVYTDAFIFDGALADFHFHTYPEAYYHNGAVILFDGTRTVRIDLATEEVTEYSADEFSYPDNTAFYYLDGDILDRNALWVASYGEEKRVLSLDFLAERNAYAAKIKEWATQGEKKMVDSDFGFPPTFLSPAFSLTGTDVCLWYYVLDRNGSASYVLFLYDFADDTVTYIGYGYTMETADVEYVYPIPIVQP